MHVACSDQRKPRFLSDGDELYEVLAIACIRERFDRDPGTAREGVGEPAGLLTKRCSVDG